MTKEQILRNHLHIWIQLCIEYAEENAMLHHINNEWWQAADKLAEFFYKPINQRKNKTKQTNENDIKTNRNRKRAKHGSR